MRKNKQKIKQFTVRIPAAEWKEFRAEANKMFTMGTEASDNVLACYAINNAAEEMARLNTETKYRKS